MTQQNFVTRVGLSLDMGTFSVASTQLASSVARMRIGKPGQPALIELRSDVAPTSPALFTWTTTGTGGSLRIDLTQAQLAALGGTKDKWTYAVDVITSAGQIVPVSGAQGYIEVVSAILAKAS